MPTTDTITEEEVKELEELLFMLPQPIVGTKIREIEYKSTIKMWDLLPRLLKSWRIFHGIVRADDERLLAACNKVGIPPMECDTADHLADLILEMRDELSKKDAVIEKMREVLDFYANWSDAAVYLRDSGMQALQCLEWVKKELS